jgi:putative CRISPR-associated protein (TIGR02619 family)
MQTIIMTVGTSLRTNRDNNLPDEQKRPWINQKIAPDELMIQDREKAIAWMNQTPWELISAETHTLYRLNPQLKDEIILLYSATTSGQECAEVLQQFFEISGQSNVQIRQIPEINYDLDEKGTVLEKMAKLLKDLIKSAKGNVTLAATGGFKAQTMIMALVGNSLGVPVCYVHEQYQTLVYLPYLSTDGEAKVIILKADLPISSRQRNQVNALSKTEHHCPRNWDKAAKILSEINWVDHICFDKRAFTAPQNGIKVANYKTRDGYYILWLHLYDDQKHRIAVSIETTGYTDKHLEDSLRELRERLGHLL